eukprot:1850389-Rhodomonas_salina.4
MPHYSSERVKCVKTISPSGCIQDATCKDLRGRRGVDGRVVGVGGPGAARATVDDRGKHLRVDSQLPVPGTYRHQKDKLQGLRCSGNMASRSQLSSPAPPHYRRLHEHPWTRRSMERVAHSPS